MTAIHLTQPQLIDSILEFLKLADDKGNTEEILEDTSRILLSLKMSLTHCKFSITSKLSVKFSTLKNQHGPKLHPPCISALASQVIQRWNMHKLFGGL